MAMKKAEMEAHREEYCARMAAAQSALDKGLYHAAVDAAMSTWDYIDGMMQYERKYLAREFDRVSAIDLVLKYAPLILDVRFIEKLGALLDEYRRIVKNTSDDLRQRLATARSQMWDNHRLWTYLERNPDARQDQLQKTLGGDQDYWRGVAQAWEKMGLVTRRPDGGSYQLALSTRMGQIVPAKCPTCGHIAQAPKGMWLEPATCPECRSIVMFVFLATIAEPGSLE